MSNVKLDTCPFCGGESIYEITRQDTIVDKIPQLFCNDCKMTFEVENDSPFMSDEKTFEYLKEKLHATWNTRKPMDRIVEQLEKASPEPTTKIYAHENEYTAAFEMHEKCVAIVKGVQNE